MGGRLEILPLDERTRKLYALFGGEVLAVPSSGRAAFLDALAALVGKLGLELPPSLSASLGAAVDEEGRPDPLLRFRPRGEGVEVEALVRPFVLRRTKAAVLDELAEGGHRALIFSQFVDMLAKVRARLDGAGRSYAYLDGSMSPAARDAAVDAFRAGTVEHFLISLRAGGLGLNLTGADYVIHLDPWWNPAVEDQATDRAHRIGQERPVTVYRLVAPVVARADWGAARREMEPFLENPAQADGLEGETLLGLLSP